MENGVPHNFQICVDLDGNDTWVGTAKGLGWAIGEGYYPGVRENPAWLSDPKIKVTVRLALPRRPRKRKRSSNGLSPFLKPEIMP